MNNDPPSNNVPSHPQIADQPSKTLETVIPIKYTYLSFQSRFLTALEYGVGVRGLFRGYFKQSNLPLINKVHEKKLQNLLFFIFHQKLKNYIKIMSHFE